MSEGHYAWPPNLAHNLLMSFITFELPRYFDIFSGFWVTSSEKAMAPHSSTLAWKIPWTEEPGRLQSMGSLRVGHDWATSLLLFTFMHWRRKWQPTPVFLSGKSHGRRSPVGYSPWGRRESDTTERLHWTEDGNIGEYGDSWTVFHF